MAETSSSDPKQKFAVLGLVFSVLGAMIAAYLLREHLAGGSMLGCSKNGTFDCETVNRSCYSEVKGIPIALWGLFGYAISAVLCGRRWRVGAAKGDGSIAFAFLFGAFALLGDAFLLYAQSTQLHAYCLWCIFSYVASLGLTVSALLALGSPARVLPAISSDWGELGSSKPLGYVLIVIIGLAFGFVMLRPPPDGVAHCGLLAVFNAPPEGGHGITLPPILGGTDKNREEILHAPFLDPGPGGGYWKGAEHPKMTIVEFGDLECPACRHFSWTMDEFMEKHPNDVRWVFRHYPLDMTCNPNVHRKIHDFACSTARAAEGAGLQGKFWDFEGDVYKKNDAQGQYIQKPDLSDAALEARAKALGLNVDQWKKDSSSDAVISKITDDAAMGGQLGIESTPTIFINGRMISGGRDVNVLEQWLDMAKKGELDPPKKKPAASNP